LGNGELASLAYGSLKELHKIEELYQREELIWGEIRGPFGGFRADFSTPFWVVFAFRFYSCFDRHFHCPLFGRPLLQKLPVSLGFLGIGPRFECFGKFTLQIAVCLRPALLKCDVALFVLDAILDVLLPIILGSFWTSFLGLDFGVPPFADLPVYGRFLDLGCWSGPLFRPVLDPVLDRISRHSKTRLCFLPHKKSSDVTLPIRGKSAHPALLRLVEK
jgi:hypothetical protein